MIYGTFFTITPDNVSTTLNYTANLMSDLTPLLLPIIAVFLGLMIFWAITGAIKK
jgi:hypothetical protein